MCNGSWKQIRIERNGATCASCRPSESVSIVRHRNRPRQSKRSLHYLNHKNVHSLKSIPNYWERMPCSQVQPRQRDPSTTVHFAARRKFLLSQKHLSVQFSEIS